MHSLRTSMLHYVARMLKLMLLLNAFVVWAAEPQMDVSKAEAQAHLVKKAEPVYPVFAKAAGVDGVVHVRVGIGTNGRVGALSGSSGPPSLFKAAEDAVLSYVYKPFDSDGKPVYVQATVDVAFHLLSHTPLTPPPLLSREKFWGSESRPLEQFSSELQGWLMAHFSQQDCDLTHGLDGCPLLKPFKNPHARHADIIGVFEIPVPRPGTRLYLVSPRANCGVTVNCPKILVEETGGKAHSVLETFGSGFYAYRRPYSPYPDIFIASHASALEVGVEGYVNAGGEWGQLYCGDIEINEDQTERDEVRVCN